MPPRSDSAASVTAFLSLERMRCADHPSLAARGEIAGMLAASRAEDLRQRCFDLAHKHERRIRDFRIRRSQFAFV